MKVGFTGTREGMSDRQKRALSELLRCLNIEQLHHGACVGADQECVLTCKAVGASWIAIYAWPCDIESMVSDVAVKLSDKVMAPVKPLDRNQDIVMCSDLLIAAPRTAQEQQRSGTWATIRYARKAGIPVIILDR